MTEQIGVVDSIERRVRLILLLDASREAGIDPLPTLRLHLIAYLANVLFPVWQMPRTVRSELNKNGSILKLRSGPFYPDLQADLDRLVGMGIATVENLRYEEIDGGHFRLDGRYRINLPFAQPILSCLRAWPDEAEKANYVRELVFALSALSDEEIDRAAMEDATYSDPSIGIDNVIDFGEWSTVNFSRTAAIRVGEFVSPQVGDSEKVHLYIRHLRRRLQGAE